MGILLAVGIGGFAGACLRYIVSTLVNRVFSNFPVATLLVNIAAALLIGLIAGFERNFAPLPAALKALVSAGFLGGLSTFSTFSLESVALLERGKVSLMAANIAANAGLSIVCVLAGLRLMRLLKAALC
jgi:CrcB protein